MLLPKTSQSIRLLQVGGVILVVLAVLVWYHPQPEWAEHVRNRLGGSSPSSSSSPHDVSSSVAAEARLVPLAHRLASADDFLDHFAAVRALPSLSQVEANETCTWNKTELDEINFMFDPGKAPEGRPDNWVDIPIPDEDLVFPRREWQDFLAYKLIPYKYHAKSFNGRGLVIVGGNGPSLKRIKLTLRQLNRLGSTIPVELHYWDEEIPEDMQKRVLDIYPHTTFNDLSGDHNIYKTSYMGFVRVNYNLKVAALINSRFAEIMLLDADCFPMIRPEELFDSKKYTEYGTVFWPDLVRTRPENPIWSITNTKCRMDEMEQESGQMMVDKRKYWYHLQLSMYMNDDDHWRYYGRFLLGDKDTFRFAWKALHTSYGWPSRMLTNLGFTYIHEDGPPKEPELKFCGTAFGQYHPDHADGRIAFVHANNMKKVQPWLGAWLKENRGGVMTHHKTWPININENPYHNFKAHGFWDSHEYVPQHEKPKEGENYGSCMDYPTLDPQPASQVAPGTFEETWIALDGYSLTNNWTIHED